MAISAVITVTFALSFVSQCFLSVPVNGFALPVGEGRKEAFVVGDSIVVFTQSVSTQAREDIRNGTLLAQLVANKQVNHENNPKSWYEMYTSVLGNIGFVIQSFNTQKYVGAATFNMEQIVIDTLKKVTSSSQNALAKTAIDALGKLPAKDHVVDIFVNQSTHVTSSGNFQVCVCDQSSTGDVVVDIAAVYFSANKYNGRFLWSQWNKADITLFTGPQKVLLNEALYAKVRDTIAGRLKNVISALTAEIKI